MFVSATKLSKNNIKKFYKFHYKRYHDPSTFIEFAEKWLGNMYVYIVKKIIRGYIHMYSELKESNNLWINWIYGPGYGSIIMEKVIIWAKKHKFNKIVLNLSLDPTEKKETILRRFNFYVKFSFRAIDITFREKYGPLIKMEKIIN